MSKVDYSKVIGSKFKKQPILDDDYEEVSDLDSSDDEQRRDQSETEDDEPAFTDSMKNEGGAENSSSGRLV